MIRKMTAMFALSLLAVLTSAQSAAPADKKTQPSIPKVPELALEWRNFDSKAWDKALRFGDFKVATSEKTASIAAKQPSEVRMAHDGNNFYVRFTAVDNESAKAKTSPPPVDEFANEFPRGDHAEIWIRKMGAVVFAFDRNGNRYEAWNYDKRFLSGFRVLSRSTADGWGAVLMIPMRSCVSLVPPQQDIGISFVRHIDHGDGNPERSTATGQFAKTLATIKIEW